MGLIYNQLSTNLNTIYIINTNKCEYNYGIPFNCSKIMKILREKGGQKFFFLPFLEFHASHLAFPFKSIIPGLSAQNRFEQLDLSVMLIWFNTNIYTGLQQLPVLMSPTMACLQRPYKSSSSWSVGLVFTFFTFSAYCSNSAYTATEIMVYLLYLFVLLFVQFFCDTITILLSSNAYELIFEKSVTQSDPFCPTKHVLNHYASCIILRRSYRSVSQRDKSFACQHECSLYPYKLTGYGLAFERQVFSGLSYEINCRLYIAQLFARARIKRKMT